MSSYGATTTSEEVIDAFASKIQGRIFVITGTSEKGLGAYTAISLARKSPAHLVLVARNKAKVDPVVAEIAAIDPGVKVTFLQADLTDFDSVRAAAAAINADASIPHIDVLINNAGIMNVKQRTLDKQGFELTLSANHLGHFLLTNLVLAKIRAAGPEARVVNVSSNGHRVSGFRFDDYNFSSTRFPPYDGWTAYGQSKTANILFTVELARRGVPALAVHPGAIWGTSLGVHIELHEFADVSAIARSNTGRPFAIDEPKTLTQGCSTTLVATLSPALAASSGAYLENCAVAVPYEYASDEGNAKSLWALSEEMVGQKFEA